MATFIQLALRLILLAKMISCEFTNPGKHGVTLFVGDTIHIAYRNITFKSYSLALWQQLPSGDAASLGPALYGTSTSVGFSSLLFSPLFHHLSAREPILKKKKETETRGILASC